MVKIFYVGGSASSSGMLRAVLAEGQIAGLAASQDFTYLGAAFPSQVAGAPPATIIEVSGDTAQSSWKPGFYRAERPPLQFDETLRSLEQPANTPAVSHVK
jgi:hypothetical protein